MEYPSSLAPIRATEPREGWETSDYYLPERYDYEPIFDFSIDSFWDVVNTYIVENEGNPVFILSNRYPMAQVLKSVSEVSSTIENLKNNLMIVRDWDTEIFADNNGHNLPIAKERFLEMHMRFLGNGNMDPAFYDAFPNKLVRNTFLFWCILGQFSLYEDKNYPDPKEQKRYRGMLSKKYGEVVSYSPVQILKGVKNFCENLKDAEKNRCGCRVLLNLTAEEVSVVSFFADIFLKYSHNDFLGNNIGEKREDRLGYVYDVIKNRGHLKSKVFRK